MFLRHYAILGLLLIPRAAAKADIVHKCVPLVFSSDGSITVHEHIPGFAPLCYSFTANPGQHAAVIVSRENKMKFSIVYDRPGDNLTLAVSDDDYKFSFVTEARTYRILVASGDLHASADAFFTLTATLN